MPAHHNAEAYLDAYLEAAGIRDEKKSPLFRSVDNRRQITANPMARTDVLRMVKRRAHGSRTPLLHVLPHVPGDRHHGVSGERRDDRERPSDRGARIAADDEALRPHER